MEGVKKTRLKDLYVINYRSQGLTKKIRKTHQIVLANRSKARVRSEKEPRDGSGYRNLKGSRGYMQDFHDT
jgi:hypothetical protein